MSKNKENNMFGKKKSKLSVLPVIFSSILAAGALAGTGVSIWHVSKNYQESSEFKKTYSARIQVDPVAFEKAGVKTDKAKAEANLKDSAQRFSAWLKFKGAESYDVSYELDTVAGGESYENHGWLSANFTVAKVTKKHISSEDEEKIDNDPYLSYYSDGGFNTNNRTLVYRWYQADKGATAGPYYTLLDFETIFKMPTDLKSKDNVTKTLIDKDGKPGILYSINTEHKVINDIYNDLKQAAADSKKTDPKIIEYDFQKPRLYIINNIEQMFNEINYHSLNYYSYDVNKVEPFKDYHNLYDGTEYQTFSTTVQKKNVYQKEKATRTSRLSIADIVDGKPSDPSTTKTTLENAEALNYIDLTKYATIEANFLNKYVEKIYKFEDNDYQKIFPDKITDTYTNGEPSKEGATVDLKYAWFSTSTSTQADQYLKQQVESHFKCKITNIDVKSGTAIDALTDFKKSATSREVPPKFVDTIFGNNLIGILSLGFLLFLIALLIILALLYRTTGVMSWICMMFMLSITGMIAISGSWIISMSLLFGLFTLAVVGFIASLAICGRIKRRICSNEDTSVAVIKGLKKSLWPIVDVSFITLLFGICFTYIAPLNLNPLGIVLIAGGFNTFICMYLLNALLMLLFFNNGLTMNKFIFLGRPNNKANEALSQGNSAVPSNMDATKLEFAFYDKLSLKRFGIVNKTSLIILGVFGATMIAGIVVFAVLGLASSNLFHSSMCIVVNSNQNPSAALAEIGFRYTSMSHYENWWYFYCDAQSQAMMDSIRVVIAKLPNSTVTFGNIVGNTNKDILNYAMISMLVAAACASVYTGIRSNWTAFVPMLAGSILVPILIIGIGSMVQIKFDQNVVLGFALSVVTNTLISNTMVASINEAWFRKESYTPDELKFIVNTSAKNSFMYVLMIAAAYILFIVFWGLCSPIGLESVTWLMVIGCAASIIVTPLLVSFLLYYFLLIRSKALTKRAAKKASKVYVNMDDIDEQSIEGINKFTKVKAYSKKPKNNPGENK